MKLNAEVADSNYAIALQRDAEHVCAQIDDRRYELIVREFPDGGFLLIDGTDLYNFHVGSSAEQPGRFAVTLRGASYEVKIVDPKRLGSGQATRSQDHGEAQILATMPGKVVRVLVELGTEVKAGAGIVVVEAMKMQNELKTPKAGTVVKLNATVGETVNAGDVLAVIA
jgi:biotin carboxyl carrier protein